jgi:hypothetical protein
MHYQIQTINRTGIGLAGIDGLWWLPALEPFRLPAALADELAACGQAIFALFDTVARLYPDEPELQRLLNTKVPADIPRLMTPGQVLAVRPDFQLVPLAQPPYYRLVATELEICPSAQGFAHAMQVGYGLRPDLAEAMVHLLAGRELLFVGTGQWSEFLFDQLAFCKALHAAGGRGRVLYDTPIREIANSLAAGRIWQPPMFGIRERPADWNNDLLGRIAAHGLQPYLWPNDEQWPPQIGNAMVWRFGYFDCFQPEHLKRMLDWQAAGATMLNPTQFILDSKVLLAALHLPFVREQTAVALPGSLAIVDRCIPHTLLLEPPVINKLIAEREQWIIKYAGYDKGNMAWGGRSLRIGAQCSPVQWAALLSESLALPWPIVAQRNTPSAQLSIAYTTPSGETAWLHNGTTRLRSFLLRNEVGNLQVAGTHLTLSGGTLQVSEGTDAVQAPVSFAPAG